MDMREAEEFYSKVFNPMKCMNYGKLTEAKAMISNIINNLDLWLNTESYRDEAHRVSMLKARNILRNKRNLCEARASAFKHTTKKVYINQLLRMCRAEFDPKDWRELEQEAISSAKAIMKDAYRLDTN